MLASLNHPHIAAIYDLVQYGESRFLVLELVSGETLADRIAKGPIPVKVALTIAKQIAEALSAAHEKGIIHRDLKPANIKITPDGKVKVLDFGLAKMREAEGVGADPSDSSSAMPLTTPGMILGTAAYMSPEQAVGEETDRMTDIWAFGCVLFEMLAAERPFDGKTSTDVLASVLKSQAAWDRLPAEVPQTIRRLLRHCLDKDRKDRLHDIADARIEIEDVQRPRTSEEQPSHALPRSRRWAPLLATAILMLVAGVSAAWFLHPGNQTQEMRPDIMAPASTRFAISPDGNSIAYVGSSDGEFQLFLRPLKAESGTPIPGTSFVSVPFWSPDSRFLAFSSKGKLYTVDTQGGAPRFLTDPSYAGGSWNKDGVILFSGGTFREITIFSIAARGGEATPVTRLVGKQQVHFDPRFLPDGKHFIYWVRAADQPPGIWVDELGKSSPRRLLDADSSGVYAAGYLLFNRQGTLYAQQFDPDNATLLSGEPFPVAQGVSSEVSASPAGRIVYQKAPARNSRRQFVWLNRDGTELRKIGAPIDFLAGSLSAGGRYVSFNQEVAGNTGIWLLDTESGTIDPFTSDEGVESLSVISPDGRSVAFTSNAGGAGFNMYRSPINRPGTAIPILKNGKTNAPTDWSREGLLYRSRSDEGDWDIWLLPIDGNGNPGTPQAIVQTGADERDAQFSDDGKWIVYRSNKSGIPEIYIQPLIEAGEPQRISTDGGMQARWNANEVFFVDRSGKLISVEVRVSKDGVKTGTTVALFNPGVGVDDGANSYSYIVGPDAKTFLVNTLVEGPPSPIHVILNWKPPPRSVKTEV